MTVYLRLTNIKASPSRASRPSTCTTVSRFSSYNPPWMLSAALLITAISAAAAACFLAMGPIVGC